MNGILLSSLGIISRVVEPSVIHGILACKLGCLGNILSNQWYVNRIFLTCLKLVGYEE